MINTKKENPFEPTLNYLSNTDTMAQRARLLKALMERKNKGCTTIEAREDLNVMSPAARVFELRHFHGYKIDTVKSYSVDAQGHKHRNARYVLLPVAHQEGEK